MGVPYYDVDGAFDAGAVHVVYGTSSGLNLDQDEYLDKRFWGERVTAESHFGRSLAAGAFDAEYSGSSFALGFAIGAPEDGDGKVFAAVPRLGRRGLADSPRLFWWGPGARELKHGYGSSLAAGDFTGSGAEDLAIGIPGAQAGRIPAAGAVDILFTVAWGAFDGDWRTLTREDADGYPDREDYWSGKPYEIPWL